eukprot:3390813-Pleurochrysis_carterae.AAC.1
MPARAARRQRRLLKLAHSSAQMKRERNGSNRCVCVGVYQLNTRVVIEHEVLWLEVSEDDALFVEVAKRLRKRGGKAKSAPSVAVAASATLVYTVKKPRGGGGETGCKRGELVSFVESSAGSWAFLCRPALALWRSAMPAHRDDASCDRVDGMLADASAREAARQPLRSDGLQARGGTSDSTLAWSTRLAKAAVRKEKHCAEASLLLRRSSATVAANHTRPSLSPHPIIAAWEPRADRPTAATPPPPPYRCDPNIGNPTQPTQGRQPNKSNPTKATQQRQLNKGNPTKATLRRQPNDATPAPRCRACRAPSLGVARR